VGDHILGKASASVGRQFAFVGVEAQGVVAIGAGLAGDIAEGFAVGEEAQVSESIAALDICNGVSHLEHFTENFMSQKDAIYSGDCGNTTAWIEIELEQMEVAAAQPA